MEKRIAIITCCLFFYTNFFSQLTADFSASTTTVCVGQSVSFTNLSSSDAIHWDWSFQTSTGVIQNYIGAFPPPIMYNTPGNYYVILVVEDLGGFQDGEIKYNYINVVSSPIITLTSTANSNNQAFCIGNSLQPAITYSVNYASSATVTGLPAGVGFSVSTTPTGCLVTITGTPTVSGIHPFTVQSLQNYCSSAPISSNGTITVNTLPIVNAGNDQTVCAGTAVTLSGTGANTYSWDNGVTNGVAFTPSSTGTYTVTGTSSANCVNTDQVVVTVNALPIINAGVDQTVCAGTAVTLSGTGANTYSWDNGVINGVPFIPASTATYTVTGTNTTTSCTNTDQVLVIINALPIVNAGIDQTVCAGTAVTLSGTGANTYSWDNGVINGVPFTPTSTTTYAVTGTNTLTGCINTDQVVVTVNALPIVNAGIDQIVCAGTAVTLSGTGANTYSWDNGVTNGVAFTPTSTGTYTVTGTSSANCVNTDQVVVIVNALPIVHAGIDQTVCAGTAVTLSGSGANTYSWNNGITNGVAFTPASTATYTVTGTNTTSGCTNTDQVVVTVNSLPIVNAGIDQTVCAGTAVTLSGSGANTYSWNNGVTNGVAFTPASTTTYTVTGTNTSTSCTNTDQVVVNVNALPTVNAGIDQTVCAGTVVTLSGTGANTYSWNNGVTNGVAFTPASTTTYTVTGTNTSTGCTNTDQVVVNVNSLPTVNAGIDQTVCVGTAVTLSGTGANTYSWNNGVINGVPFIPASTATYTVTGTNTTTSCTNTDQVLVTIDVLPTAIAGGNITICSNGAASVYGASASGGNVLWTHNGNGTLTNTTTLTPTYNSVNSDAGNTVTLTLTVNNVNSCGNQNAFAFFTVVVEGNPTLALSSAVATANQLICNNTPITNIQYVFGGPVTATFASGLPAGVVSNISGNSLTISGSPTITGTFNYMVSAIGTCSSIMLMGTIEIQGSTLELLSAPNTNNQLICLGNPIEPIVYGIGSSATVNDLPTGLTGTFSPGIPNFYTISGTPLNIGSFYYTININGQCGNEFLIGSLNVQSVISGNTSGNDTTVCDGSAFELIGGTINTNGNTVYSYLWEYSSNVNGPFTAAPGINTSANYTSTMNANDPFNYFRRIVFAGACSDTAAVAIVSADPLPAIVSIGSATICVNQTALIQPIVVSNGTIGSWTTTGFGDLLNTSTAIPFYI
ncbi:MAG: hypothetical protein RJA13_457, partial [Bacteroidota bacterium]